MAELQQWKKSKLLRHPQHLIELSLAPEFVNIKCSHGANLGTVSLIDVNHDPILVFHPKAIIIKGSLLVIWILPLESMILHNVHSEHGVLAGLPLLPSFLLSLSFASARIAASSFSFLVSLVVYVPSSVSIIRSRC
jgi:hypothetical protein